MSAWTTPRSAGVSPFGEIPSIWKFLHYDSRQVSLYLRRTYRSASSRVPSGRLVSMLQGLPLFGHKISGGRLIRPLQLAVSRHSHLVAFVTIGEIVQRLRKQPTSILSRQVSLLLRFLVSRHRSVLSVLLHERPSSHPFASSIQIPCSGTEPTNPQSFLSWQPRLRHSGSVMPFLGIVLLGRRIFHAILQFQWILHSLCLPSAV
mmetsp:Transcript_59193/g.144698  ORF Transcript_59193/g.144698 Transcript_59193/m.144698 type:complete len:204 (-) Transcript_59193:1528-2139(-)